MYCRGKITITDSLGFLALYFVYIAIVIFGRIINQRLRKKAALEDQEQIIDNSVENEDTHDNITEERGLN